MIMSFTFCILAWNSNQSPFYQSCVSNQRVAVKSPSNSAAKLNSDSPSVQKDWPVPQESESNSNKPPNTLSTTSPTPIAPVTKSQVILISSIYTLLYLDLDDYHNTHHNINLMFLYQKNFEKVYFLNKNCILILKTGY